MARRHFIRSSSRRPTAPPTGTVQHAKLPPAGAADIARVQALAAEATAIIEGLGVTTFEELAGLGLSVAQCLALAERLAAIEAAETQLYCSRDWSALADPAALRPFTAACDAAVNWAFALLCVHPGDGECTQAYWRLGVERNPGQLGWSPFVAKLRSFDASRRSLEAIAAREEAAAITATAEV